MRNAITATLRFIRRNLYFVILGICVIGIITALILTTVMNGAPKKTVDVDGEEVDIGDPDVGGNDGNDENSGGDEAGNDGSPVSADPLTMRSPLADFRVGTEYSVATLVYSNTLREYRVHYGVDLFSEEGAEVRAAYDGTVESIENDAINGMTVIIDHGDLLKTVYRSLAENVDVTVGDRVLTGEKIGCVGNSSLNERADGAHLHFEVIESGKNVDPFTYMESQNK